MCMYYNQFVKNGKITTNMLSMVIVMCMYCIQDVKYVNVSSVVLIIVKYHVSV